MSNAVQNKNYVLRETSENATQVDLSGAYEKLELELQNFGLLAPVYFNSAKSLYLYSHHHNGMVWEISTDILVPSNTSDHLVGVAYAETQSRLSHACPDNPTIIWHWIHEGAGTNPYTYSIDPDVHVKCSKLSSIY